MIPMTEMRTTIHKRTSMTMVRLVGRGERFIRGKGRRGEVVKGWNFLTEMREGREKVRKVKVAQPKEIFLYAKG